MGQGFGIERTWGRLLRAHRVRAGMSQEKLARVSGVSVRGIRMIENGDRRPRLSTVNILAEALALTDVDRALLVEAARPSTETDPDRSPADTEGVARAPHRPSDKAAGDLLSVKVLGPFEIRVNGSLVHVDTPRLRTVLAVLAMSAGTTVPMDRLTAAVWDERPPLNPRRSLQTYAGRLRTILGGGSIVTEPAGLRLVTLPDNVDALKFTRILGESPQATPRAERGTLVAALDLWRGEPFEGIDCQWLVDTEAPRLLERRFAALEQRIDGDIREGRHGDLVAELGDLTARYPFREPMWVRLLVALDRCGRQAEALTHYGQIRTLIAEELGVEPGPDLQRCYADLLAGRPVRSPADLPPPAAAHPLVVPRQLPPAIAGFVGRRAQSATLDSLIASESAGSSVAVVTGGAGVGKTAFAVRWAHRAASRFPDGQIYVDLKGFSSTGQATTPSEAIRAILSALEVPSDRLPHSISSQVGLYRSLVADKRILIVLDNARDAEQVRPILPAGTQCVTVVTSRDRLTGLVATEAASVIVLDVLTDAEARQLIAARIGRERAAAEPEAVAKISGLCANLPLALAVIAARTALRPDIPLSHTVTEICERDSQLDGLASGEADTTLRTVFSWSYDQLTPQAARLFRLLALHPGPELSIRAAAALTGNARQVPSLIAELVYANLLVEDASDRFHFHDLLRAYAFDLAVDLDSPADRDSATQRLLDHYLHTAITADRLLNPQRTPIDVVAPAPDSVPHRLDDRAQAMDWFAREHRNLCAAVHRAADGYDRHTWQLAWAMTTRLSMGRWPARVSILETALAATERLGDQAARVRMHLTLGFAHNQLSNPDKAHRHLTIALQGGDPLNRAHVHLSLAFTAEQKGDPQEALAHAEQALQLYREAGHLAGQAKAFNTIGWHRAHLGDFDQALSDCRRALELLQGVHASQGEAETWDSLGFIHHRMNRLDEAVASYRTALRLHGELGNTDQMAKVYLNLAETHQSMADFPAAREAYHQAISLLDTLGHSDADHARRRLHLLQAKRICLPVHHRRATRPA